MAEQHYRGPPFPPISPPPVLPTPTQGLQPSYNYPFPRPTADPFAQTYPHASSSAQPVPPPPIHHLLSPPPHQVLPPAPSHPHHAYAQHPLLAYPTGLASSQSSQPHASSSSIPSNGCPPPPPRAQYQPYSPYEQSRSAPPPHHHSPPPVHYHQPALHDLHDHHSLPPVQHQHQQHSPSLSLDLAPLGSVQLPALHVSASPEVKQFRERLPSITSLGEVVAPSYSGGGMPLGGPSSGLGGDRFAGRAMPPKAKKSRKSVQTVQVQDEFDDGNSSRGDYDEEGDGDDYDPLTGKKRKRHRAGPGGDSLTCHQCRGYYESGLRCSRNKISGKAKTYKQCILVYCDRDVMERYGVDPDAVRAAGPPSADDVLAGHNVQARYKWSCPSCDNFCQCSACRKKNGLEPVGALSIKTKKNAARSTSAMLKRELGYKKKGHREDTPDNEDLSHLSASERAKYIKERDRKNKLVQVAQERLEKLRSDVDEVTIEEVGVLFEEEREPWEVEGDEGIAGRVDLREFFWRLRKWVPLPDKMFQSLDNFDKPLPDATAKRMAASMIDCLVTQSQKGYISYGETPEAIADELAVAKEIETLLANVKVTLKPTASPLHLRKTLHGLLTAIEAAEHLAEYEYADEPWAESFEPEESVAAIYEDPVLLKFEEEAPDATTPKLEGDPSASASVPDKEPVASSSNLKEEESVKEEVAESVAVSEAPPPPPASSVGDSDLPSTTSLLIAISHRILMSPDVRYDMEEGLAQRAEMIKLQGREVKAFVEGRGKKRLKLEAEMASAIGAAAKATKLVEIDDLPREDHVEHLRLVTSQRLILHSVAGRSAAVLGVDAEDRIYVSLAPDWEGRRPTGWGVGIHVYGKGFNSVWASSPPPPPEQDDGIAVASSVSGTNDVRGSLVVQEDGNGSLYPVKAQDYASRTPASANGDLLPVSHTTTTTTTNQNQWHHFPTATSIRHLLDVVQLQALDLAISRGDLILTVHLPTSTSPSQRVYPDDAWYHSSTNLGEYAEEGKVKELLNRMGEVADLLEMEEIEIAEASRAKEMKAKGKEMKVEAGGEGGAGGDSGGRGARSGKRRS